MLFGEPGVDPRIQPLHRFPDEWDLPWASTYHSSLVEHGDAYHEISCALETEVLHGSRIVLALRYCFAPDPYHCWAPDAELHAYAFVVPGLRNDHTSVVPEDWNGWLPPHPEQQRQNTAQSKSGRLHGECNPSSNRQLVVRTELKKLIRKELRISTAVISDSDVENLAAALDGNVSVEELLSFIERGSATFFSVAWFQSNGKTTAAPEEKAVPKILNILKE
ncbi:unnamed protein product [Durusdinium trenchii]|uniref:Uncharacterized protein n=1 Tax=Durusdinium trenchii TaxID=1381693 RepID=A0ABP0HBG1_9DINO